MTDPVPSSVAPAREPRLAVVGGVPELAHLEIDARVVSLPIGPVTATTKADALVFDLRAASVAELSAVRNQAALTALPLLLVSHEDVPESVFAVLRASDVVVVGRDTSAHLRRRLALLMEAGRRRSELLDEQTFGHAILDGVDVGIVTTDEQGVVTFANRAAADMLKLERNAAGTAVEQLLGLPKAPSHLLAGEQRCTLSYPLARDSVELDLELSVSRGEGRRHDRVGFFFIFRDVREEKRREAERQRFERLAAMGTMVAGFAHEVRNPVAAMRSIAEELAEELIEARVHTPHVGLLLQMVERIERLVRTSLQFGRPAAPKRSRKRPWEIVSQAITELSPRLRKSGQEFIIEVEPNLPDVNVDERQLAQALVILLNNALDSTGSARHVAIRVRRKRGAEHSSRNAPVEGAAAPAIRFDVIDDGPGIPADLVDRIFDPFFTTKSSGTGLGLSIAQQIVSENGARLEVVSSVGALTVFSIIVPVES